ncbi:MAG: SufD family Fe-S cluster assembly protein [Lachnospiraceae bacterium]|nr:SufD family Fe-S cluster assembly protein [Lachnospiraceae bacterium]
MDKITKELLEQVAGLHEIPVGAYNIRKDGELYGRNVSANINIVTKTDKPGIDIIIKDNTVNESVHIPVIIAQSGLKESVYNDFFIGENCDVTIIAGCGIHNGGKDASEHSGIHSFDVGKNSKVRYVEKHYGQGEGTGERIMNPTTNILLREGSFMEMDTVQIEGIDSTKRETRAKLMDDARLVIKEKIMTHDKQFAETDFSVDLDGVNSSADLVSRSVAKNESKQFFKSEINGNAECHGHSECDAIIMDNASVTALPALTANNVEASLIHEAAIGKIAGEQLIKLMTLGLSEEEAEKEIVAGFLK